jgi:hypothetical protein
MSFARDIEHWFGTEWGGSMVLPDGWFGRPYDNQHMLTSVTENDGEVTLVLDDILRLHFTGLKSVRANGHELILGPFEHLRFEWTPYGGGRLTTKDYLSGEVKIVSMGT